jgi:hypothetical protein
VRLVEQWRQIERDLPGDWGVAELRLTVGDEHDAARAAALLGPINPGQRGTTVRLRVARGGEGPSADAVARLLSHIDRESISGELALVASKEADARPERAAPVQSLAASWDEAVAGFPPDWTDVYAEIELVSTDWLERAALLLAPANPARGDERPAFRFRVARQFGYGVAPEMLRRCLERLDDAGIRGRLRILRVLCATEPVATQGPVWYVEGRSV